MGWGQLATTFLQPCSMYYKVVTTLLQLPQFQILGCYKVVTTLPQHSWVVYSVAPTAWDQAFLSTQLACGTTLRNAPKITRKVF